ncbi:hypothetical protein RJ640_013333 [Escallonia rubra]|uniref:Uncharacterized protein n=1 Tax=Escallonia rubra TaxID=112253 RepID=A0AA88UAH9_9ASTE|nr:hypothetical protein RJ640_013333 [Escallonia rubra]
MLLRLDSMPEVDPTVRELRWRVSRQIIGLHEILDVVLGVRVESWDGFLRDWDDAVAGIEDEVGRERGGVRISLLSTVVVGIRLPDVISTITTRLFPIAVAAEVTMLAITSDAVVHIIGGAARWSANFSLNFGDEVLNFTWAILRLWRITILILSTHSRRILSDFTSCQISLSIMVIGSVLKDWPFPPLRIKNGIALSAMDKNDEGITFATLTRKVKLSDTMNHGSNAGTPSRGAANARVYATANRYNYTIKLKSISTP